MSNLRKHTPHVIGWVLSALLALTLTGANGATAASSQPPHGVLDAASSSTAVSGIAAETELSALRTAFLVNDAPNYGSRYVKFTATLRLATTVNATTADVYVNVTDDYLSPPSPVRVAGSSIYLPVSGGVGGETVVVHGFAYLRHSQYTAEVTVKRTAGSGTLTAAMPGGTVMSFLVEDIGDVY